MFRYKLRTLLIVLAVAAGFGLLLASIWPVDGGGPRRVRVAPQKASPLP